MHISPLYAHYDTILTLYLLALALPRSLKAKPGDSHNKPLTIPQPKANAV